MPTSAHRFNLHLSEDSSELHVISFSGQEHISEPYRFDIELVSERSALERYGSPKPFEPPHPWRDLGAQWLGTAHIEWLPPEQGVGLRITGPLQPEGKPDNLRPRSIMLRIKYRTQLIAQLGINDYIGGPQGLAFILSPAAGTLNLGIAQTARLDHAKEYPLNIPKRDQIPQPRKPS